MATRCYLLAVLAVLGLAASGHARTILSQPDSNLLVQPGVVGHIAHAGVTGAHAAAAAADNLALIMDDSNLWTGMNGGPNCSVTCNGENVTAADDNGKGVYSCWGFFKAFCKGKGEVEEKKIAGAAGFKCKGHFVGVKTKCGARVAICEGDKKGFAVKFVKGEEGKMVVFKKGGCLGTSSFIGKPYNKSSDAIDLSWPEEESVPQVWDAQYAGVDLLQSAIAEHVSGASNGGEPLAQGRCGGFGGGVKVVKVKKFDEEEEKEEEHEKMDFEELESAVNSTLLEEGISAVPAMPSMFDWSSMFSSPWEEENGGPSCKVTCNGKPAYFKGKLPCFGELSVKCKKGVDAPKYAPEFFAASCKGFFSGTFFGSRCKGQATGFVDGKYADKLKICTGQFGMFAKAKKGEGCGKFVKGSGCKGKSLAAFFLDIDEESTALSKTN